MSSEVPSTNSVNTDNDMDQDNNSESLFNHNDQWDGGSSVQDISNNSTKELKIDSVMYCSL